MTDWLETTSKVITGGATMWGVVLATRGVSAWREQLYGRTSHEVARETLKAVLEVREAVHVVRDLFISAGEKEAAIQRYQEEIEEVDLSSPRATFLMYRARWETLRTKMIGLEADVLEAEVLWGSEVRVWFKCLTSHVNTLDRATKVYVARLLTPKDERDPGDTAHVEHYMTLHDPSEEDGAYLGQLFLIIGQFERILVPHLRPQGSTWSKFWGWVWSKLPKRKA